MQNQIEIECIQINQTLTFLQNCFTHCLFYKRQIISIIYDISTLEVQLTPVTTAAIPNLPLGTNIIVKIDYGTIKAYLSSHPSPFPCNESQNQCMYLYSSSLVAISLHILTRGHSTGELSRHLDTTIVLQQELVDATQHVARLVFLISSVAEGLKQ